MSFARYLLVIAILFSVSAIAPKSANAFLDFFDPWDTKTASYGKKSIVDNYDYPVNIKEYGWRMLSKKDGAGSWGWKITFHNPQVYSVNIKASVDLSSKENFLLDNSKKERLVLNAGETKEFIYSSSYNLAEHSGKGTPRGIVVKILTCATGRLAPENRLMLWRLNNPYYLHASTEEALAAMYQKHYSDMDPEEFRKNSRVQELAKLDSIGSGKSCHTKLILSPSNIKW